MKTYQDTETGKLWTFEDHIDPYQLQNKRIPSTLTENVLERPNEEYVWFEKRWIHRKEVPENYEEPLSSGPIYNPAWVSFLFPLGTFVLPENKNVFNFSLEMINDNSYDGKKFQTIATTITLAKNLCKLPVLISYDGSLAVAMEKDISTANQAVNVINTIRGAFFLGGIPTKITDHQNLEVGHLSGDGKCIYSYMSTAHNRLRLNGCSISESAVLMSPNYIKTSELHSAFTLGMQVMEHLDNLTPEFIMRGYSALVAWNTSDALNNLWIAVEQLTSFLWERDIVSKFSSLSQNIQQDINKLKENRRDIAIYNKHELLKLINTLDDDCVSLLHIARKKRNDLVHEGLIPEMKVVEDLWFSIFDLIKTASSIGLEDLLNSTSYIQNGTRYFNKHYPPGFSDKRQVENLDFSEWKQYQ